MEELLRVEHLRKIFTAADGNDFPAVDDVTFSVGEGEKVAIIGESGSGKTTVAKMVTRLLDATSGSIILEGQDITKASGRKLRQAYGKIQMVFQMPVKLRSSPDARRRHHRRPAQSRPVQKRRRSRMSAPLGTLRPRDSLCRPVSS